MRASIWALVLACAGCSQEVDHPDFVPTCEPGECLGPAPGGGISNNGGADSGGTEEVGTFTGSVRTYADDFFDAGTALTTPATVSAIGEQGSRVRGDYDGSSFQLDGVLKAAGNWFLVEPIGAGLLPTLTPVDTRVITTDLPAIGVVQSLTIDGVFALMGTERSTERAQIALRVVDAQGASIAGALAEVTAERIAYRTAGTWVANEEGTDDSGLIFLGNVAVGSALTTTTVVLSGRATGRAQVALQAGAVTVATVVVTKK